MRLSIKKLLVGLLAASSVTCFSVLPVNAETNKDTGKLVLTNWYKPAEIKYETGKFFNPYIDNPLGATSDPTEIGKLDHVLKMKTDSGAYEVVQLKDTLDVGEYRLSPSHVNGTKALKETDFTITKDKNTVVDLVYTNNIVECNFTLTANSENLNKINSVSYEVHAYNKDGSLGQKILRGSAKDKVISFNIDPGNYAMKIGNQGYFTFTADGENPTLSTQVSYESLKNPDGSALPKDTTTNQTGGQAEANITGGKGNPQTPQTSLQGSPNAKFAGIAVGITVVGVLVLVIASRTRKQRHT